MLSFARYWLPVILWMILIFSGSGDALSVQRTSRIIGPIIHWLFPNMPPQKAEALIITLRKCGHGIEFGLLSLLLWRALVKPSKKNKPAWCWADTRLAFLLTALYAVSDEVHQSFITTRQGSFRDVIIDCIGAAVALLLLWLFGRVVKRW